MKPYTKPLIAMVLACLVAGCSSTPPEKAEGAAAAADSTGASLFYGARVIPGDGKPAMENVNFVVENGKFTAIGSKGEVKAPKGSAEIDLSGQTVTPVFVNLHAHPGLFKGDRVSPGNYSRESVMADLKRYAYYGIGAVASLGGDQGETAFRIRDEQRERKLEGARMYTSGRGIAAKGGAPSALGDIPLQVSNAAEARKAVSDEATRRVDLISIWVDGMKPEIYRAVIDEAHKRNLKVVAHLFSLADAKNLVESGIDGLAQSIRDREVDDELIAAMKARNVFLVPTLTAHEAKFVYAEKVSWLTDQLMREVYPAQLSAYLSNPVTMNRFKRNPELPALKQQYATAVKNLKKMSAGGVKIGLGSDSGSVDTYPGYFEIREIMLMAEAGMPPMDVITAASSVSAGILGADDLGAIAVGKTGTFLTFSNNPAEKMENIKDMVSLYINGTQVERSKLVADLEVEVRKITEEDKKKDQAAEIEAARLAAEAKLPHYGDFVLGPAVRVRSMAVPTPKSSKVDTRVGPPDRIGVSMRASAGQLRKFYAEALPAYSWKTSGSCWERQQPGTNKGQQLCVEVAANSAVITITEK
ncbi:MAG: amidohydrolase family protein [Acidobacteria bacterium]|nr:amidohydrolase family protein [Acidobacteriota bacterium]